MVSLIGANIAMAMAGGLLGALRSFVTAKEKNLAHGFMNMLVGVALAAMVCEHFMIEAGVWAAFGVGVVVGSVGGHAIDVIQATVPDAAQSLVKSWLEKLGVKKD